MKIFFRPKSFVFPQPNFSSPYETLGFKGSKSTVGILQEMVAFMHEPADFTFLMKISGKNAYGCELLRIRVNDGGAAR
ncbi:hypothetical protein [Massilia putida]|uniref:hypothetical protein n=1 Tax=Massilia putida TaxID=1141883 RepID=UPI0012EB18BA|nr:hypothetical protein [Massilia putida]